MRIWLSRWEWACCGEPFEVGSSVRFSVRAGIGDEHAAELGPEVAETIDGVETHHENEPLPTIAGTVTRIHAVHVEMVTTSVPRPVRPLRPRLDLGRGFSAGAPERAPFVTTQTPVPGTARLEEIDRVPWRPVEGEARGIGYVVDVRVDAGLSREASAS